MGFSEQNPTRLSGSGGCQTALGNARGNRFSPYPSGQRADELDKRLLHIDAEVLSHAFRLSFELGEPLEIGPEESAHQFTKRLEGIYEHNLARAHKLRRQVVQAEEV